MNGRTTGRSPQTARALQTYAALVTPNRALNPPSGAATVIIRTPGEAGDRWITGGVSVDQSQKLKVVQWISFCEGDKSVDQSQKGGSVDQD